VDDRDEDVAMAAVPSGLAGRRGGVSAEVYREEEAACYVKKVKFAHISVFVSASFISLQSGHLACKNLSGEVLAWLSVCSKVQMICIHNMVQLPPAPHHLLLQ